MRFSPGLVLATGGGVGEGLVSRNCGVVEGTYSGHRDMYVLKKIPGSASSPQAKKKNRKMDLPKAKITPGLTVNPFEYIKTTTEKKVNIQVG